VIQVIKVKGDSMLPELTNGDFVIVSKFYWPLKTGHLVVANHPNYQCIIKRIVQISPLKGILLSGTNAASVTTEQMGWVSKKHVLGKVLFRINQI